MRDCHSIARVATALMWAATSRSTHSTETVPISQSDTPTSKTAAQIALGGGCHWCTEAVFQSLRGVGAVEQGFAMSEAPFDAWSEAVRVTYHPAVIGLRDLVEIHLRTHASTSDHSMRGKYRSALYACRPEDDGAMRKAFAAAAVTMDGEVVTRVLSLAAFKASDQRFRDYYQTGPERPFCRTYIDPKLALLRQRFGRHVKGGFG